MKNMLINENGRSMIEMLGVLAIIGVLSVGGIAGFSKAMESYKTNQSIDQISTMIANVKNLGLRQHNRFTGFTTNAAIKMKLIPEEMIVTKNNTSSLVNVFGGEVKIGTSKSVFGNTKNTNEKDFVIAYYNLPKETCLQIMAKDWGGKKVAVLAATSSSNLSTGGYLTGEDNSEKSECKDSTGVVFCRNQPMPLAKASSACNCGKNNTCSIAIWNF